MKNMRFKVGDRVKIKSLDWYNENKDEDGIVELSTHVFIPEMVEHCGTIVTIKDVFEDIDDNVVYYMEEVDFDWTDEMIEGLVEEEIKPKFKVGDKVILDPYPCVVTDVNWRDSLHGFVYTVRGSDFGKMVGEEDLVLDESEKKLSDESWKPSKEEMDVLYGLAYITNQYDEHKEEIITRLYQDLKREFFNGSSYENMFPDTEDDVRRRSTIQILEYARSLDNYNQYGKEDIDKNIAWLEKQGNKPQGKSALEAINEKNIDNQNCVKSTDRVEPKFKIGDKIKLKYTLFNDIFGVIGHEPEGYRITNILNGLTYFMSYSIEHYYELVEEEIDFEKMYMESEKRYEEEYSKGEYCHEQSFKWGFQEGYDYAHENEKLEINLKNGYQFKDGNGNVINATKIIMEKKKKDYPKTYEECLKILGFTTIYTPKVEPMFDYDDDIIALQKLKNCRNAYWKIAGEEMKLGKPWVPDYDSGVNKYGIICMNGVVQESNPTTNWERHLNKVLDFPTPEMRDAFKENFKSEIEICKELL